MFNQLSSDDANEPKLLAQALKNPALYGDGDPSWSDAQTASQAVTARRKIAKFLRNRGEGSKHRLLASTVGACEPNSPCLSGACPACMRASQRWFVGTAPRTFHPDDELLATSLVFEIVEQGKLSAANVKRSIARVKRVFRKAGIGLAVGGLDISFNEERDSDDPGHWALQLMVLVSAKDRSVWEKTLRSAYPRTDLVPRPIFIQPFDGAPAGWAYEFKPNFVRRVSYSSERMVNGVLRPCRNTSDQPLRVTERLELLPFLNDLGLAGRLFLIGARTTNTLWGIAIVPIGKRQSVRKRKRRVGAANWPVRRSKGRKNAATRNP